MVLLLVEIWILRPHMYCNFQLVLSRTTYLKHADAIRSTSLLAITVQNACNWAQRIRVLTFILEDRRLQKEKDHFVTTILQILATLKTVHLSRCRVKDYTYSKNDFYLHSPLVVVYVKYSSSLVLLVDHGQQIGAQTGYDNIMERDCIFPPRRRRLKF